MLQIKVVDQSGLEKTISAPGERTLMELIRDNGFGDLQALCGGGCSCATCHVQIDPDYFQSLPVMSADEHELLSNSVHRNQYSRFSCQVLVTGALDGATVLIVPED